MMKSCLAPNRLFGVQALQVHQHLILVPTDLDLQPEAIMNAASFDSKCFDQGISTRDLPLVHVTLSIM